MITSTAEMGDCADGRRMRWLDLVQPAAAKKRLGHRTDSSCNGAMRIGGCQIILRIPVWEKRAFDAPQPCAWLVRRRSYLGARCPYTYRPFERSCNRRARISHLAEVHVDSRAHGDNRYLCARNGPSLSELSGWQLSSKN